jgi:hypothetical protein
MTLNLRKMNFELLPNELLLNIFQYFTGIDLVRAFYDLSNRFNDLVSIYFRDHGLDFQSMSKRDFEIICQQYLSLLLVDIVLLRLSDDDGTPQQIDHFLSYGFTLNQFARLQSLSLCHLHPLKQLEKFSVNYLI